MDIIIICMHARIAHMLKDCKTSIPTYFLLAFNYSQTGYFVTKEEFLSNSKEANILVVWT